MQNTNKKRNVWRVVVAVVAVLLIVRMFLPTVVLHYANKSLSGIDGYFGHIDDIDLHIYRGAYVIENIYIDKIDSTSQAHVPFVRSKQIDLSVEWKSLFKGRIVGEIELLNPELKFTKDKAEPDDVQKDSTDFKQVLEDFMPLEINFIKVVNGTIRFIDATAQPKIDIALTNIQVLAQNLNSVQDSALLPATLTATANVYKGDFSLNMKIDPLASSPTFDMNAEIKNTQLPDLNDFLKAYAKFDVSKGTFGMYTEVASKDGKFVGYVKPVIENLDVKGMEDRNDSFFNKLYESLVGAVGVLLKNSEEKQIATKIPIEGEYGQTSVGTWYAIIEVLRNAFVQALYPAIDHEITILSVDKAKTEDDKNFFEKIFTKSDKDENQSKKK